MKETARFYSSLSLLIVLNTVIKPLWIFGIDRQVQNTVGASAYGIYFSLFNLSIVLSFLLDLGFSNFVNRQLAASDATIKQNTGSFVRIKLILAVVYLLLLYIIGLATGVTRVDVLLYAGLIQIATSFFVFFRTIITANQWFTTDAWLSVLDKTLMIAVCGSFLYLPCLAGSLSIERFLFFQLSCTSLAVMVTLFILYSRGTHIHKTIAGINWRPTLLLVLPFAMIILLQSAHNRLDAFLLERLHPDGAKQAGLYAASFRLLDAANMIGYLFASFLMPFIARQWSGKKEYSDVVLSSRHLLISYSITLACIGVFLAPWLQYILYRHTDNVSITTLQYCMPTLIGYSLTAVYGTVLTATGRVATLGYITLAALLLNILLNVFLIPAYGAIGCCIAALITQSMAGIVALLCTKKSFKNYLDIRSLLIYTFTAAVLLTFFYVCQNYPGKPLLIIIAAMITAAIMIGTRLINIRQWVRALTKTNHSTT